MTMVENEVESRSPVEVLKKLGYEFNECLELRNIDTEEGFKFVNQAHYEELADAVAEHIQDLVVERHDMRRVNLPVEKDIQEMTEMGYDVPPELRCPIFVSKLAESADVVLVLLCGTGRVSAGQWARKLCINESLATGSVIPFLEWAAHIGMGTVVLNPNETSVCIKSSKKKSRVERVPIPYCSTSEAHVHYVWERVLKRLPCKHFVMVAHSYGGVGACHLLKLAGNEVLNRLRAVAFTDAMHGGDTLGGLPRAAKTFLLQHSINWVTSKKPLDTELQFPHSRNHYDAKEGLSEFAILRRMGMDPWAAKEFLKHLDETDVEPEQAVRLRGMSSEQRTRERRKRLGEISFGPRWPQAGEEENNNDGGVGQSVGCDMCCKEVSAGTDVHEKTTMSAFKSVTEFLLDELLEVEWEPKNQEASSFVPRPQGEEYSVAEVAAWLSEPLQRRGGLGPVAVQDGGEGGGEPAEEEQEEELDDETRQTGNDGRAVEEHEDERNGNGGEIGSASAAEDVANGTETRDTNGEALKSQEVMKAGIAIEDDVGTTSSGVDKKDGEDEGSCRNKEEVAEGSLMGASRKRNQAAADIEGAQG